MCTTDSQEISESDCCGNGCANCILDSKPSSTPNSRVDLSNKSNVLHKYRRYKLIQRTKLFYHVLQLKFAIVDKEQLTDFILDCPPGHHIMMRAPNPDEAENPDKKDLLRPYSPFWTDVRNFEFEILVNLNPNGKMTKYIETLQLGDEVEFRGPIGVYVHEPGRVLFIFSQGVAIAPTIAIVESILADEEDMTRVHHYSCFQDVGHIIFREKLMELKKFWNFSSYVYLSRQNCKECEEVDCQHFKKQLRYKERIHSHRLEKEDICKALKEFGTERQEIVICGSKHFQGFIEESLVECCVNKENIFVL